MIIIVRGVRDKNYQGTGLVGGGLKGIDGIG